MTVLCYVRPWNEKQFKVICNEAFSGQLIHYISDFPGHASGFQEQLAYMLTQKAPLTNNTMLDQNTLHDVVMRCRLLRAIPAEKAYE